MTIAHLLAGRVVNRSEGITRNVEALVGALRRHGVPAGVRAVDVGLGDLNRLRRHVQNARALSRLARAAAVDPSTQVVHAHVNIAAMALAIPRSRRPLVVHVWNALYRPSDGARGPSWRDRAVHALTNGRRLARVALARADAVVVSSAFQVRQLLEAGVEAPIHRIPNGIDAQAYRPPTDFERAAARAELGLHAGPVVLYYGHLSAWKGVATLAEALPELLGSRPQAQVVLAPTSYGRGGPDLQRRLDRHGLASRVRIVGSARVETLLRAADVAAAPYLAPVGTASYPNVVLECMAAGVPVVASRVGGLPELVRPDRSGLLVEPGSPSDLAQALGRALDDPVWRAGAAAAARRHVVEFHDWADAARSVATLYERVGGVAPAPLATPEARRGIAAREALVHAAAP